MKKIQVPAILEGISTLKDGGLSLRYHTQEVEDSQKVTIMNYLQQFGWLLFAPQEHDDSIQLEAIRKDVGGKSHSQRLRSVIYLLYQQRGRNDITFEQYYAQTMEGILNQLKEKLD